MIPELNAEVDTLTDESKLPQYLDKNSDMTEMIKQLDEKMATFKKLQETSVKYNGWQEELRTQPTIFQNIEDLRFELENRHQLWHALHDWQILKDGYEKMQFNAINDEEIKQKADYYQKISNKLFKNLPSNPIIDELKILVETFKEAMPIVQACRNENLSEEHWDAINSLIPNGKIEPQDENFTLQSLIDLDVNQYQDEIVAISRRATGETKLKTDLKNLDTLWKEMKLKLNPYKERDNVWTLAEIDDLYNNLDEWLAQINMIRGNQYKAVVENEAEALRKSLITMNTVVEELVTLMKSWIYLENIFSSQEIRKTLMQESSMFDKVDANYRQIMTTASKQDQAYRFLQKQGNQKLVDLLRQQNETVDVIMKQLNSYLETKRGDFPRFNFLSDDELLMILANQSDPSVIQGFLKQLFDGLFRLELSESQDSMAMESREGEKVVFVKPVKHVKAVEEWLNKIQDEMRNTMTRKLKNGQRDYSQEPAKRREWLLTQPAQVVATVGMIQWCQQTEDAISAMQDEPDSLNQWFNTNDELLKQLTNLVRGDLSSLHRSIITALITQDVHAKDIVEELKKDNVASVYDFNWQK